MRVNIKFLFSTAIFSVGLFLASTASASMHYFSEMLTSDLMTAAPNYQMVLNANLDDSGNLSEIVSNSMTAGAGLGDASIAAGGSMNYTHSFGPSDSATGIIGSQLSVLTSGSASSGAFTSIALDDNFWINQATSFQVLGGQVDATLFINDGELLVNVSATGNDLDLVWSMFRVNYEIDATRQTLVQTSSGGGGGDISAAIPEPGAATLFGAGILIVGSAIRRRSHES
ncbi:MAG: hypothetical protein VX252_01415 [Myxococcota bacterium]|nr:hypothetical protein [Myxococcota bacterium]